MQIRTALQHAWATAVETVGLFTQQALKSNQGDDGWLRFFAVMGSEIALRENAPTIPGTPSDRIAIRYELSHLAAQLNVISRLQAYGMALRSTGEDHFSDDYFFLLSLNPIEDRLTIQGFPREAQEQAVKAYEWEESNPHVDAVLVSVESVAALRRAYPNYFADTTAFVDAVEQAIHA